jgi:hypothetical protein
MSLARPKSGIEAVDKLQNVIVIVISFVSSMENVIK